MLVHGEHRRRHCFIEAVSQVFITYMRHVWAAAILKSPQILARHLFGNVIQGGEGYVFRIAFVGWRMCPVRPALEQMIDNRSFPNVCFESRTLNRDERKDDLAIDLSPKWSRI